MHAETAADWTLAAMVVSAGGGLGWAVGRELGAPLLGAVVGLAAGASANYARGCKPCRRHVRELRAALSTPVASGAAPSAATMASTSTASTAEPPPDCPCRKGRR